MRRTIVALARAVSSRNREEQETDDTDIEALTARLAANHVDVTTFEPHDHDAPCPGFEISESASAVVLYRSGASEFGTANLVEHRQRGRLVAVLSLENRHPAIPTCYAALNIPSIRGDDAIHLADLLSTFLVRHNDSRQHRRDLISRGDELVRTARRVLTPEQLELLRPAPHTEAGVTTDQAAHTAVILGLSNGSTEAVPFESLDVDHLRVLFAFTSDPDLARALASAAVLLHRETGADFSTELAWAELHAKLGLPGATKVRH